MLPSVVKILKIQVDRELMKCGSLGRQGCLKIIKNPRGPKTKQQNSTWKKKNLFQNWNLS